MGGGIVSDRGLGWAMEVARTEDQLDRERRARLASGLAVILLATALANVALAVAFHGLSRVMWVFVVATLLIAGSWQLARSGRPTESGLLLAFVLGFFTPLSSYLSGTVSTWPLAVPVSVLVLVFMLPLRWAPAAVLLGSWNCWHWGGSPAISPPLWSPAAI